MIILEKFNPITNSLIICIDNYDYTSNFKSFVLIFSIIIISRYRIFLK